MTVAESQKIIIAGAGPGGAALAQVLRASNIPFEIYDRESKIGERRGGAFLLDAGLETIMKVLPADLGDVRVASANHSINELDVSAFIDAASSTIIARAGHAAYGQPGFAMIARRDDFRNYLTQGLDIQTSKRVSRYEEDRHGVTVHFTDGSSTRGAMLVGADGASSQVRRQLLSNPPKELNSHVPISGEVVLPRHAYLPLLQAGNGALVANAVDCNVTMARMEVAPDGSWAKYWWIVAFASEDPEADAAWVMAASPASLHRKAMEACKHFPDMMVDVIRRAGTEGVWQPQIRFTEWVPPSALPRGRVTLLGDAAHNTTPFGGMGANTALKDAADLGRLLKEHVDEFGEIRDRGDVDWILQQYETVMLPRGQKLVLDSRRIADAGSDYASMASKAHGLTIVNEKLVAGWGLPTPAASVVSSA